MGTLMISILWPYVSTKSLNLLVGERNDTNPLKYKTKPTSGGVHFQNLPMPPKTHPSVTLYGPIKMVNSYHT